jgi:hypothetical protein
MKRIITPIALLVLLSNSAFAQVQTQSHQETTPAPNARYEVMQSQLAARWTFRLDKYSGHVAQLVRTNDDENKWEDMEVIDLPKLASPLRPHFQLFTSGIAARHTFLIDTDTGKTWVIVGSNKTASDGTEYEISLWQPFAD